MRFGHSLFVRKREEERERERERGGKRKEIVKGLMRKDKEMKRKRKKE